jgi:SAM-dependent methyltransferase
VTTDTNTGCGVPAVPADGRSPVTQSAIWNDLVGHAWVRYSDIHDRQAQPFGEAAMNAIGSVQGLSVLDVGCGTGATTYQLAARGARDVLGVDLSAPLIAAARQRNHRDQIAFEVGDASSFLTPKRFDIVYSRFGVMFFEEPVAAFSHLRTLASDEARLAFCCWAEPAANPWMLVPLLATIPVLGPPRLPGPGEPGPFSLSSTQTITEVLTSAGWNNLSIDSLSLDLPHPAGDADAVAHVVVEFNPPIVQGLAQHPERAADAIAAIAEALTAHQRDGVVHFVANAHIVTATASTRARPAPVAAELVHS